MIDQAAHIVQSKGKSLQPTFPKSQDSVNAYEQIEGRRDKNKDQKAEKSGSKFTIEKSFSPSSTALARTLGNFQKVLDFLEEEPNNPDNTVDESNKGFGLNTPHTVQPLSPFEAVSKKTTRNDEAKLGQLSDPDKAIEIENTNSKELGTKQEASAQLELDLFPKEAESKAPPVELKKLNVEIQTPSNVQADPEIRLGNNPTEFKIHNLITDEIIKAISNSNKDIEIKTLNESIATKLANQVRQQLQTQPHALASDDKTAPVKAFEKTI